MVIWRYVVTTDTKLKRTGEAILACSSYRQLCHSIEARSTFCAHELFLLLALYCTLFFKSMERRNPDWSSGNDFVMGRILPSSHYANFVLSPLGMHRDDSWI
jgi:hypothetical protein